MLEECDDLRQGVTEGGHAVLDELDRCRAHWSLLTVDGLLAEIELVAVALESASPIDWSRAGWTRPDTRPSRCTL